MEWAAFLKHHDLQPSMSRRGNCHDNTVAESFFTLLKRERIRRKVYRTRDEARGDVFDYIEMFYNPTRKHARNGMLSPIEFERQHKAKTEGVYKTRGGCGSGFHPPGDDQLPVVSGVSDPGESGRRGAGRLGLLTVRSGSGMPSNYAIAEGKRWISAHPAPLCPQVINAVKNRHVLSWPWPAVPGDFRLFCSLIACRALVCLATRH